MQSSGTFTIFLRSCCKILSICAIFDSVCQRSLHINDVKNMAREKFGHNLKSEIINDFLGGMKQAEIAKNFKINVSCICRLIKKYRQTGEVKTKHLGGRPRKTSTRTDREIVKMIKKDPFISSKTIVTSLKLNIHHSTVRRRAVENNLKSYRPAKNHCLQEGM